MLLAPWSTSTARGTMPDMPNRCNESLQATRVVLAPRKGLAS